MQAMKLKPQTSPIKPKLHILTWNNQTKNLVDGDKKNNPQAKMLVLNWHHQNT